MDVNETEAEKPNGKTIPPEAWDEPKPSNGHNSRYDATTINRALRLKLEGKTYPELSTELGIPEVTLQFWVRREKAQGTELGKLLCSSMHDRSRLKAKYAKHDTIKFPGGSEYRDNNGRAVLVDEELKLMPDQAAGDENLVDEIFDALALKLGRQQIEITSLRIRLKRKSNASL